MNNELFQQAKAAYAAKDYNGALQAFTQCLQDSVSPLAAGEMGLLYHQIGNCLVKLKNPAEAIQAYTQAAADDAYRMVGAVNCNLGMAYASLHDYEDAVKHFEVAVSDASYDTPFKAYTGMGNALLKLGKSAEAGVAFREAALDERNPDPTKALLNLGVCFMALNRPADAVASYESALQFPMKPDTKNKLYANLGQAYVASGQMQKAVAAFEESLSDKTYFLSDSASVDYQRAIAAVSQGTSELAPVAAGADMSGLDVVAGETAAFPAAEPYDYAAEGNDPYFYDGYSAQGGEQLGSDDRFFTASDEELEQWSKGLAKQERKRRNVGLKVLIVIVLLLVVAFGAAVFAYTQGYGYPQQETVVQELFADPEAAKQELFAESVDADHVDKIVDQLVQDDGIVIDGMNKSMSESTVYVTATTPEGGSVKYEVSLVRDMIGWKVSNAEYYFTSQK